MQAKEIPHNVDAEHSVLCSMMNDEGAALKAAELLTVEDFYDQANKVIYAAILTFVEKGQKAEKLCLIDYLQNKGQLEAVGGMKYLGYLDMYTPTSAMVVQHAKIVKEASLRRQLLLLGRTLISNSVGEADSTTQLEAAQQGLTQIGQQKQETGPAAVGPLVDEYINYISDLKTDEYGLTGMPTFYEELDSITNGLNKSDFIVLAARPSMGKTAMALNIIENIILHSEKDYRVAFFSLEMSSKQIISRLLANLTGIDNHRMDSNQLQDDEWHKLWLAVEMLNSKGLYVDDTPGLTITSLRSRAKKLQQEQGLDLIVIDYLQLMEGGKTHSNDRQQQIAEISRALKSLARELNVPVIALSQLSRNVENRQTKRPVLSDIRDSGSIEQDADLVMFLYRDDYYFRDSREPGVTEMIIAKHRNGPLGCIKFLFEKQYTKFVQLI